MARYPRSMRHSTVRAIRPAVAAGIALLALVGAGCSSDLPSLPLPTTTTGLPRDLPRTGVELAALMRSALAGTGSAALRVTTTGVTRIAAHGGIALVNGELTGVDLAGTVGALHNTRLLVVNSVGYVRLHPATSRRPWAGIPAAGGHGATRSARAVLHATKVIAAPADLVALADAGHAHRLGTGQVGGSAAAHFTVRTEVSALNKRLALRTLLHRHHIDVVTLNLWVDGAGHPLVARMNGHGGSGLTARLRYTAFNQPVHLQAPEAATVARSG